LGASALGCEYAKATFEAQRLGHCPESLLAAGELESVGLNDFFSTLPEPFFHKPLDKPGTINDYLVWNRPYSL
jgi:hypothetical protein